MSRLRDCLKQTRHITEKDKDALWRSVKKFLDAGQGQAEAEIAAVEEALNLDLEEARAGRTRKELEPYALPFPAAEEPKAEPAPAPAPEPGPARQPSALPPSGQDVKTEKALNLVQDLTAWIAKNSDSTSIDPYELEQEFWKRADAAFGGTRAEGAYGPSDAYDALETAFNRFLAKEALSRDTNDPRRMLPWLNARLDRIPRQKNRSGEKDLLQQFSTPPHYAYAAAWAANIAPGDVVLEPSAGTGDLAVWGKIAGAKVVANELSKRRAALLATLNPDLVTHEDAEFLNMTLPQRLAGIGKPTVVVMNPPFSHSAERMGDKTITGMDLRHIDAALDILAPGGRLVAIVGAPMIAGKETQTFTRWLEKTQKEANVRAHIIVSRNVYGKYGTNFPTRMLVIDKTGPTPSSGTIQKEVANLNQMVDTLNGVRHDRQRPEQTAATAPVPQGAGGTAAGGRNPVRHGAGATLQPPVGGVGPGTPPRPVPGSPGASGGIPGGNVAGPTPPPANAGKPGVGASVLPGSGILPGEQPGAGGAGSVGTPGSRSGESGPRPPPGQLGAGELNYAERAEPAAPTEELSNRAFEPYVVHKAKVEGAAKHPASVDESAAMAAVQPPDIDYKPRLPKSLIEGGALSDIQLERVAYAGASHAKMLPPNKDGVRYRRGFFIGDGTGMGKTRSILGVILDNLQQGRGKSVIISKNNELLDGLTADFSAVFGEAQNPDTFITELNATPLTQKDKAGNVLPAMPVVQHPTGILYTTYSTLRSGEGKRLEQVVKWLGKDFDGVVVFDEAHNMANAIEGEGSRGKTKASAAALAGIALQQQLPNARILYASATGATDVKNLAYAERLGLWGPSTPFPSVQDFVNSIDSAGLSAMEQVAQDLKARGLYMAANITMNDGTPEGTVEYDRVMHAVTPEQEVMYERMAEAWSHVLKNVHAAVEHTGSKAKGAMSQFWGSNQRFWSSILTVMSMPSMIAKAKEDLAAGRSVVIQLTETNDAAVQRALEGRKKDKKSEDDEDADLDLSPIEMLIGYVQKSFPVIQCVDATDQNGNVRPIPLLDSAGNPVLNPKAVAMRDALIADLRSLASEFGMLSPIDMIYQAFGGMDNVAEVTGRKTAITVDPKTGKRVPKELKKSYRKESVEAFQSGKKRVLIFSRAGGTGFSFHASRAVQNQQRRAHYILQPGWSAAEALQGLGRTHRTNQVSAPVVRLVSTDLPSQKRFLSTVARRLDQLGALSRGQRQAAGSGGVFSASDNLASREAKRALASFFDLLLAGKTEISEHGFTEATALQLRDADGARKEELPKMEQVLNRLLTLPPKMQHQFFNILDRLIQQNIEQATKDGTLDMGMENFKADSVTMESHTPIFTDPESGAQVVATKLKIGTKNHPITWEQVSTANVTGAIDKGVPKMFLRNTANGRLYAILPQKPEYDPTQGAMVEKVLRVGQRGIEREYQGQIDKRLREGTQWQVVPAEQAKAEWDEAITKIPAMSYEEGHLISGAILSVWDRLPQSQTKLYRVRDDLGNTRLGRILYADDAADVLARFNIHVEQDIGKALQILTDRSGEVELSNRWRLKPVKVAGENRIELIGPTFAHQNALKGKGVFAEKIQYSNRFFVPTGEKMAGVVKALAEQYGLHRTYNESASQGETDSLQRMDNGVRPVLPPTAADLAAPLPSPHDLVVDIGEVMGRDVKLGAVTARNAAGEYMPAYGKVSIKRQGDITTAMHEIAHALDDHYGVLADFKDERAPFESQLLSFVPEKIRRRLKAAEKRYEGLAYMMEQWLVNPAVVEKRAPLALAHLKKTVPAEVMARLEKVAEKVRSWAAQPASQQGAANIRMDPKREGWTAKVRNLLQRQHGDRYSREQLDKISAQLTDRMAPVWAGYNWLKERRGITKLAPQQDAQVLMRVLNGHDDRMGVILEHGMIDAQYNFLKTEDGRTMNLQWLLDAFDNTNEESLQFDMRDTALYMIAERVAEKATQEGNDWRNLGGLSAGLREDWQQAQEILGEFHDGDPKRLERIREGAKRYRAFADAILRYAMNMGRISADTYRDVRRRNQFYVDMHRVMDPTEAPEAAGIGTALGRARDVIQKFKGSTRMVENPYLNLLNQMSRSIFESDRNRAMRAFTDLLATGREMHDESVGAVDTSSVGWTVPAGTKDAVPVYRDGNATYYKFEKGIAEALTEWTKLPPGGWVDAIAKAPAQLLRAGVIYSPAFMGLNAVRDFLHRTVVSRVGSTFMDMFRVTKEEKIRWRLFGGSQAGIYDTQQGYQKILNQTMRDLSRDRRIILTDPRRIGQWWAKFAEKSEAVNRTAEFRGAYRKAKAEGMSDFDANLWAALQSRDLLDYAVAGSTVKFLNRYVAFLNPGIQALRRTARAIAENPKGVAKVWGAYIVIPEMANIAWNLLAKSLFGGADDPWEEFGQLPYYQRDLFYNFWVGPNSWVKIPKPYEFGLLASAVGRTAEAAMGRQHAFEGLGKSALNASPVEFSDAVGPAKAWLVEPITNKNLFTGRYIVPPWEEGKAIELRDGTSRASRLGQTVQSVIGVDARHIDNLAQSGAGGLGRLAVLLSDVGREDKPQSLQRLIGGATGYMAESPAWSAKDVEWVMKEAMLRGERYSKILAPLRDLLKAHSAATTSAEKARLAAQVRAEAARMRQHYETTPRVTKEEKKAKAKRDPFAGIIGGRSRKYPY